MILKNSVNEVMSTGMGETTKMSISKSAEAHVIKLLTEASYRDPLGSGIRETVSNSVDSVRQAEKNTPVIVSLKKNAQEAWEVKIIDEGLGLDRQEFEKYIMGIGESTKQQRADLIGAFGGGAKSMLAYQSSYTYQCRKDGIERMFLIFKGESYPESSMLYEKPTDQANGVEVTVLLKNNWNEVGIAVEKIRQQLSYLPNVYFDVATLKNDYKIYQYEHCLYNELYNGNELHIALKGIYYPIDWNVLGIPRISVPLALRFDEYDKVMPIFNRESIQMDTGAIQAIKDKIALVAEWAITEYNKEQEVIPIAEVVAKFYKLQPKSNYHIPVGNGKIIDITPLSKFTDLKPAQVSVEGVTISAKDLWELRRHFGSYDVIGKFEERFSRLKNKDDMQSNVPLRNRDLMIDMDVPDGKQREYLREREDIGNIFFVREKNLSWNLSTYKSILGFSKWDSRTQKAAWRTKIQSFQKINAEFDKLVQPQTDYIVPEEWKSKKVTARSASTGTATKKKKDEVSLRKLYFGKRDNLTMDKAYRYSVDNLSSSEVNLYFTNREKAYDWVKTFPCYVVSETDAKKMSGSKGYYTPEELLTKDIPKIRELALAHKKYEFYMNMATVTDFLHRIQDAAYEQFTIITKGAKSCGNTTIIEYAESKNYWDAPELEDMKVLEEWVEKIGFGFTDYLNLYNQDQLSLAKEILYYREHCNHYQSIKTQEHE